MKLENLVFGVCLFTLAAPAWAYLDPGSVSLWLQGAIAAIAALAATFRIWSYKVKSFFSRNKKDNAAGDEQAGNGE